MGYSEKLKKEIAAKLRRLVEIYEKQEEIEKTLNLSDDVLLDADPEDKDYEGWECDIEEWQELERERAGVHYKLVSAFARTTHYPIFTLPDKKICALFSELASISRRDDKSFGEAIDDLLEDIDFTERKDRVRRARRVEPLFLNGTDDLWLEQMYRQAIQCFVMGAFLASCVLCRAICEIALKKYLKKKMSSGRFEDKFSELLTFCEKYKLKLLKPSTISRGRDINSAANKLMHQGEWKRKEIKEFDEEAAFELIQSMQAFLKEVFASNGK